MLGRRDGVSCSALAELCADGEKESTRYSLGSVGLDMWDECVPLILSCVQGLFFLFLSLIDCRCLGLAGFVAPWHCSA
ncbi:hypothetical protein Dimus_001626 [Dionaea muscipula]